MENKNWLSPFSSNFWGDRFLNQVIPGNFNDLLRGDGFGPSVDLKETEQEIILKADIPGINQEDLDITVGENTVTLKGEIKLDESREEKGYHLTERRYGSFYRTIPLPAEVKSEEATARCKNGVLELKIPKVQTIKKQGFKPKIEFGEDSLH